MEMYHPPPPPPPPGPGGPGHAADYFYYYYPPLAAAAVEEEAAAAAPRRSRVRKGEQRHSKICTAGGMRDRRMRLSLDVARRFFALQDKLGFDKASKTVQWLLDMSKAGIDDLTASISEDGSVLLDSNDLQTMADSSERNKQHISSNHLQRKSTTKESRTRARERARERTRERNRLRCCSVDAPPPPPPPPPPSMIHAACSSVYNVVDEQQPWELSGVVFPKAR